MLIADAVDDDVQGHAEIIKQLWANGRLHMISLWWVELEYRVNIQWKALNHYMMSDLLYLIFFIYRIFVLMIKNKTIFLFKRKNKIIVCMILSMVRVFHFKNN